jgi:hypothetical protein
MDYDLLILRLSNVIGIIFESINLLKFYHLYHKVSWELKNLQIDRKPSFQSLQGNLQAIWKPGNDKPDMHL